MSDFLSICSGNQIQTLILARRVTEALHLISQAVKVLSMSVGEVRLRPGGSLWWGHLIPDVDVRRESTKSIREENKTLTVSFSIMGPFQSF